MLQVEFEGVVITIDDNQRGDSLSPGDTYLARRNTGWKLLTCREVNLEGGWVTPVEREYCHDLHECFKVVEL